MTYIDPMTPFTKEPGIKEKVHEKLKTFFGKSSKSAFNVVAGLVTGLATYWISDSPLVASFAIAVGTEASNRLRLYDRIFGGPDDSSPAPHEAVA